MTLNAEDMLTACLVALGDSLSATWSRVNTVLPWLIEAVGTFPLLRPSEYDYTNAIANIYKLNMPDDFRQMVMVEYPISQQPPCHLIRGNHYDPNFYGKPGYYDVDHNYTNGVGWVAYFSSPVLVSTHVKIQYMASHDTDLVDDDSCYLTIPDEYQSILITSVMCRAYRERLGAIMVDPTAHMTVITQMTEMVQHIEELYAKQVADAHKQLTNAIVSPRMQSDKFDRVY